MRFSLSPVKCLAYISASRNEYKHKASQQIKKKWLSSSWILWSSVFAHGHSWVHICPQTKGWLLLWAAFCVHSITPRFDEPLYCLGEHEAEQDYFTDIADILSSTSVIKGKSAISSLISTLSPQLQQQSSCSVFDLRLQ